MGIFDGDVAHELLGTPEAIQYLVLRDLDQRLTQEGYDPQTNPNNGVHVVLNGTASAVSGLVQKTVRNFERLYLPRSRTMQDLYAHMSDRDYLQMTATPASTTLSLWLDADYLRNNALAYDSIYRRVVIPADSVFSIGGYTFGIYYPITLSINTVTNSITALYDTTVDNPLYDLQSNIVEAVTMKRDGFEWLVVTIPVYQFTWKVDTITLSEGQTLQSTIPYTHQFYAARVYSRTRDTDAWAELEVTLSDDIYDRQTPTAKLTLIPNASGSGGSAKFTVPYIYVSTGMLGRQVRIETLSTQGAMDVTLTSTDMQSVNIAIGTGNPYAEIFQRIPTIKLMPRSNKIIGGSSGLSQEELRDALINNTLHPVRPITPLQVRNYFAKAGFMVRKVQDEITNRIYIASRTVYGTNQRYIPITIGRVSLVPAKLTADTISTVMTFTDKSITILPTTLYRYDTASRVCEVLTDTDRSVLSLKTTADLAAELNTTTYVRAPYHLVVYSDDKYPVTKTFDLTPEDTGYIQFVRDNPTSPISMAAVSSRIVHLGNQTGGYEVRIGVTKTDDMKSIPESAIRVVLMATDRSGRSVYFLATKTASLEVVDMYTAVIPTDYHITADRYFRTQARIEGNRSVYCDIGLDTTFDIRMLVEPSYAPGASADAHIMDRLPPEFSLYLGLSSQTLRVVFGSDLSDGIYNTTTASLTVAKYAQWDMDVPLTYDRDIYARDENNLLRYEIVDGRAQLIVEHHIGDTVLDADGEVVYEHRQGEFKYAPDGSPVILEARTIQYHIDALMIDARLYASSAADDVSTISALAPTISGYVDTVSTLGQSLREQTKTYFQPIRTMGTALYSTEADKVVEYPLGLSFAFRMFVPRSVHQSAEQRMVITDTVESIVAAHVAQQVISMQAIATALKAALSDMVVSIDTLGINGDVSLQTLVSLEEDDVPIVARKLVVAADGTLSLQSDITLEFVPITVG